MYWKRGGGEVVCTGADEASFERVVVSGDRRTVASKARETPSQQSRHAIEALLSLREQVAI